MLIMTLIRTELPTRKDSSAGPCPKSTRVVGTVDIVRLPADKLISHSEWLRNQFVFIRAEPELMYPDQKIEACHSDRSRAKRGEVEEPFVWKLEDKRWLDFARHTAPGWDTSSFLVAL